MSKNENKRLTARDVNGERSSAYFYENTASATEFTGMTPTPPLESENAQSYFDLLGVPVTSFDGASKSKKVFRKRK